MADILIEPRARAELPSVTASAVAPPTPAELAARKKRTDAARKSSDPRSFMPRDCAMGRLFIDFGKLLPESEGSLDALATSRLARDASPETIEQAVKLLKKAGIQPGRAVKSLALCATDEPSKSVAALRIDPGTSKDVAKLVRETVTLLSGETLEVEDIDGLTALTSRTTNSGYFVFVNPRIVLLGDDVRALEAASRGGDGEQAFAAAKGRAVWGNLRIPEPITVDASDSGAAFDVRIKATLGAVKASILKEQLTTRPDKLDPIGTKYPPLAPLVPVIKRAQYEAKEDVLEITAVLPKAVLLDVLRQSGRLQPADLQKMLAKPAQP